MTIIHTCIYYSNYTSLSSYIFIPHNRSSCQPNSLRYFSKISCFYIRSFPLLQSNFVGFLFFVHFLFTKFYFYCLFNNVLLTVILLCHSFLSNSKLLLFLLFL